MVNGGVGAVGGHTPAPDPRVARVVGVPDGDSVRVRFVSGAERTIRYIGVAAPHGTECGAALSVAANRRAVSIGSRVRVAFDVVREDGSGELLAYVYGVPSGRLVNAELAREGAVTVLSIPPNLHHVPDIMPAGAAARDSQRGLWRTCPTPKVPGTSRTT